MLPLVKHHLPENILTQNGKLFAQLHESHLPATQNEFDPTTRDPRDLDTEEEKTVFPLSTSFCEENPKKGKLALHKKPPDASEVSSREFLNAYTVDALRKLTRNIGLSLAGLSTREKIEEAIWSKLASEKDLSYVSPPDETHAALFCEDTTKVVVLRSNQPRKA